MARKLVLSRRHLLIGTAGVVGGAVLAACGATPAAPTAPSAPPAATATPQPPGAATQVSATTAPTLAPTEVATVPATAAPASGAKVTLDVHYWEAGSGDAEQRQMFKTFQEKNPNITIKLDIVPGDQYHTKLKTRFAAGDPPDIFDNNGVVDYPFLGVVMDIDPLIERDHIDLNIFSVASISTTRFALDNKLYCLPTHGGAKSFGVNLDLWKETGLDDPNKLYDDKKWTWNDIITYGKAFMKKDDSGKVLRWFLSGQGDYFPLLLQNDASIVSKDMKSVTIDQPNAIEVFQFRQDLMFKYNIAPTAEQSAELTGGGLFENWLAPLQEGWTDFAYYDKTATTASKPFTWDLVPHFVNKKKGNVGTFVGFEIPKAAKHVEEAWQLCKYLSTDVDAGVLWGHIELPALKAAAEKSIAESKIMPPHGKRALLEPVDEGYMGPNERFTFPKWGEASQVVNRYLSQVDINAMKPDEACKKIADELKPIVDSMWTEWNSRQS